MPNPVILTNDRDWKDSHCRLALREALKNEYYQQAEEFCEKYGVTIKATRLHTVEKPDPKDEFALPHTLYQIHMERVMPNGTTTTYDFTFHQCAAYSHTKENLRMLETKCKRIRGREVCLTPPEYETLKFRMNFIMAYDILACLTKYDPDTFQNFCAELGYSDDSIKAQKVYFAVQEDWANVRRLFSDCLDELSEIQ